MTKTGCCGSLIRVLLGLVNILFLLIGLAVFTAAAVLRWSSDSILNKISRSDDIHSIIDVSAINSVTVALLIIGGFIALLSLIGLVGVCFTSKFFLFVYEVIIVILFLSHAIVLIVAAFKSSDLEKEFRKALNQTVDDMNSPKIPQDELQAKCKSLRLISDIFQCCGANGPQDFSYNKTYATECCVGSYTIGCSDKTVSSVKSNGVNIIVIPNSIILGFEFLIILLVPFLIGRISSERRRYNEERIINIKPTTFSSTYGNLDYGY